LGFVRPLVCLFVCSLVGLVVVGWALRFRPPAAVRLFVCLVVCLFVCLFGCLWLRSIVCRFGCSLRRRVWSRCGRLSGFCLCLLPLGRRVPDGCCYRCPAAAPPLPGMCRSGRRSSPSSAGPSHRTPTHARARAQATQDVCARSRAPLAAHARSPSPPTQPIAANAAHRRQRSLRAVPAITRATDCAGCSLTPPSSRRPMLQTR
jgi:hypothetical protein